MSDNVDTTAQDKLATERAEALAKANAAGWNNPVPYDYSEATAPTGSPEGEGGVPQPAWLNDAVVYEWDDSYGEVGPRVPDLEKVLFQDEHLMRAGGALQALKFEVDIEAKNIEHRVPPIREFNEAGLHPVMLENIGLCQYHHPTPIQSFAIPAVLTGHDVVGVAQTGSGKTGAYLIPILSRLMGKARLLAGPRAPAGGRVRAEPLVLIICPTRELACQIFDDARRLCYRTRLRPCVIYGGAPTKNQREQLERGCDILVATPGRFSDFVSKPEILSLHRLKYTIIDEADEMLNDDWEQDMERIMSGGDSNTDADHLYMMFSATFPAAARKLAKEYMADDYIRIKVGRVGSTHANIKQSVAYVGYEHKKQALVDLIFDTGPCRIIVFVNSKGAADELDDYLYNKGLPSTSIHSDRTQREREDALRSFKSGRSPILVATGVTARGLDIANVKHVINYDLPSATYGGINEYIHRIGRTARIGNEGRATSFYNDRNEDIAEDLVKILMEAKQEIPDFLADKVPPELVFEDNSEDEDNGGTGGGAAVGGDADGWGAGGGAAAAPEADTGFNADEGFSADNGAGVSW